MDKEDKVYKWTVKAILITMLLVLVILAVSDLYKWTVNRINPVVMQQSGDINNG